MLALNDKMLLRLSTREAKGRLKIGIPNDYADRLLLRFLQRFAENNRQVGFDVVCDISVNLLSGMRNRWFDLIIAMTPDGPAEGAFMIWREPLVWVGGLRAYQPRELELPLVAYPEGCQYRRNMLSPHCSVRGVHSRLSTPLQV
jgi:DNA-binding transcriptional LysR family regulator